MKRSIAAASIAFTVTVAADASAGLYKCVKDGKTSYQDEPCGGQGGAETNIRSDHSRVLPDSPFMQQLLRRPFPTTKAEDDEVTSLLLQSGNMPLAELLGKAEARAALHKIAGERTPPPGTIGDAIDAERWTKRSASEFAREVARRVVAEYPPGPMDAKSERVSDSPPQWEVAATLRITNGLEAPVSKATFMIGHGDSTWRSDWSWITCKPDPPLEPHATRDVRCAGEPRAFFGLETRDPLHTHTILTPIVWILGDSVSAVFPGETTERRIEKAPRRVEKAPHRDERAESSRAARAKLATVPCSEKGSCGEIAREERSQWKKKNLGGVVNVLSVMALVLSLWAMTRRRAGDREAWPGAVASIALVASSAWIVATAMAVTANSYAGLLGIVGLYFGAVPFLVVLVGVAATMRSGRRTPLRLFAVSFSVLSSALLVGVMLVA